jgi:phosphate transport system protein
MKQKSAKPGSISKHAAITLRACLIAKDSAYNVREYVATKSRMALLAVQQCEKELDQIERETDETMPAAITGVSENEARELLACLKCTIDLERVGDLLWTVAKRLQQLQVPLTSKENGYLTGMADTLCDMLVRVHDGFANRDIEMAESVLRMDGHMDRICHAVFHAYLEKGAGARRSEVTDLLFMAQAFERAGDHTKNLGEELFHVIEGHTMRHSRKTR